MEINPVDYQHVLKEGLSFQSAMKTSQTPDAVKKEFLAFFMEHLLKSNDAFNLIGDEEDAAETEAVFTPDKTIQDTIMRSTLLNHLVEADSSLSSTLQGAVP